MASKLRSCVARPMTIACKKSRTFGRLRRPENSGMRSIPCTRQKQLNNHPTISYTILANLYNSLVHFRFCSGLDTHFWESKSFPLPKNELNLLQKFPFSCQRRLFKGGKWDSWADRLGAHFFDIQFGEGERFIVCCDFSCLLQQRYVYIYNVTYN